LRQLAQDLELTPLELFNPYWRSIGPDVVRDIFTCPQKAQQLSEVLQLRGGVDELLRLTQTETIPFLVITKRRDILEAIRQARKETESIESLIIEPRWNLACVLARLLLESDGHESAAASLLQEAAPNLKGKLKELIKAEPVFTACEILKAAGDSAETPPNKVTCFLLRFLNY